MPESDLTVLYAFRDRDPQRICNSVKSLRENNKSDFEVLVVDYGSKSEVRKLLLTACLQMNIKVLRLETEGWPWNKSIALNAGIKAITTPWIVNADIDVLFKTPILDDAKKLRDEKKALYCRPWWVPKNGNFQAAKRGNFDQVGVFQYYSKSAMIEIDGFDERFNFWGHEDIDCYNRLLQSGIKEEWLDDNNIYHIWHPMNYGEVNPAPEHAHRTNIRYWIQNKITPLKQVGWGRIIKSEDRLWTKEKFDQAPRINIEFNNFAREVSHVWGIINKGNPIVLNFGARFLKPSLIRLYSSEFWHNKVSRIFRFLGLSFFPERNSNADYAYEIFLKSLQNNEIDWFWNDDMTELGIWRK